jgi:hypothetical protein
MVGLSTLISGAYLRVEYFTWVGSGLTSIILDWKGLPGTNQGILKGKVSLYH